jgi:RNA chaperone Hfq
MVPKASKPRPFMFPPRQARAIRICRISSSNYLRKNKTPVTMFLVKGVKLQGIVTWFDNFSILLRRDGQSQLVYKHAVSTIMPSQPIDTRLFRQGGDASKKRACCRMCSSPRSARPACRSRCSW